MTKRMSFIACIALILVVLSAGAYARTLVSYGDEQIYVGDGGYPYSSDSLERYISSRVRQSLYKNGDIYCFSQTDGYNRQTLKAAASDYDGGRISTRSVATVAFDPVYCQYDEKIYYVAVGSEGILMSYDPLTERKVICYRSSGDIDALMDSANGLLVSEDGSFFLYESRRKRLTDLTYDPLDSVIRVFGDCHVEITADGEMYLLKQGETERVLISRSGSAAWRVDDYIYYIQSFSTSARLSRFDIETERSSSLYRVYDKLAPSIAALDGKIYMSTSEGEILSFDVNTRELETVEQPSDGYAHLEVAGDHIAVYENSDEGDFIGMVEKAVPKPVYETLQRGSRGDGVVKLQQKLREAGYLTSSADGVFGSGTERAVRLLQFDMGYDETGIATPSFQKDIFENGTPTYKQYVTLRYGSKGIRVEELVSRLRELYYTKQEPSSEYNDETSEAVERFQTQMGYRVTGSVISATQVRTLFRSGTPECDEYYTLSRYDSAPVVKRLNRRLRTLGYISASHVNESYSSYTVKAIKKFQEMAYFDPTGVADPDTQFELFGEYAPTPDPDPTPTPDPEPEPDPTPGPIEPEQAVKDAVINTMRTWMKNNLGGSYPKDFAVYTLQSRLVELGYMYDSDINSVYDFTTKWAVESFQSDTGLNVNGNANKKTLSAMFLEFD